MTMPRRDLEPRGIALNGDHPHFTHSPISATATAAAVERFWGHVDQTAGPEACWPWMLSRNYRGYGRASWNGRTRRANRVAYFLATGQDPGDLQVLHKCDHPPCVNPAHLWLGTDADNVADMAAKGRRAAAPTGVGVNHHEAKLTEDTVRAARARAAAGETLVSLAREFGVARKTMWGAVRGTTWKHVTDVPPVPSTPAVAA